MSSEEPTNIKEEQISVKEESATETLAIPPPPATPVERGFYKEGFDLAANYFYRLMKDRSLTLNANGFKTYFNIEIFDTLILDDYFVKHPIKPNDPAAGYPSGQCPGPGGIGCVDCPYRLVTIEDPIPETLTPEFTPEQKAFYSAGFDLAVNYLHRIISEDPNNTLNANNFKTFVSDSISDNLILDDYFETNPIKPSIAGYSSGQCPGPGGVGCVDCPHRLTPTRSE
jgi:hypothetical protein